MYDINLLNDFYRPRKTARIASLLLAGTLILALFSYVGILVPLKQKSQLDLMISGFSQTNSEYQSLEEEYAELSRKMEELKQRASGIAPLLSGQKWSIFFELLGGAMPRGVSLLSISYDGGTVVLEGTASDDVEIAGFMVKMQETGLFGEINVKRIYGEGEGQMFLMTGKLNSSD